MNEKLIFRIRLASHLGWLLPMLLLMGCKQIGVGYSAAATFKPLLTDSSRFSRYIDIGDSIYAEKSSYQSFSQSLHYYDSAQAIADDAGDTLLLAEAVFAKGRVYDAWNREPQKTITYFTEAARLFATLPQQYNRSVYVTQLVAHAYDKVNDSAGAVAVLHQLYRNICNQPDSIRQQLPNIAEMALISTEVHNYSLADSFLQHLTRRNWIYNDPERYDYLNHYYLTQSRLETYYHRPNQLHYLDSLEWVYRTVENPMDKMYYAENIARLYSVWGNYEKAYYYLMAHNAAEKIMNNNADVDNMQNALLQSELLSEKRKMEYQEVVRKNKVRLIWLLSGLLGIITLLAVRLQLQKRRSSRQASQLSSVNRLLDDKVGQVELLNKEIQHRVKNNLHMIFSLLHMQERKSDNEETIENLQAARLRIESIAALHNQLINGQAKLDFATYLKSLIFSVVNCLSDDKKVISSLAIEKINVPVNSYFALSLIINEWVTNSVKYATIKDNLVELNITIKNCGPSICVEYSDSGTTKAVSTPENAGLGTQIINLLCKQIDGTLTTPKDKPYHYQLTLPNA